MERLIEIMDNIRSKPEPYRRAVAFWSALIITAIIALVWINSLGGRFVASITSEKPAGDSPFAQLGNAWSSMVQSAKDAFK